MTSEPTVAEEIPDNGTANLAELETPAETPKAEEPAKDEAPKAEEPTDDKPKDDPAKPKAKTWEQRRIDELTRARREAERTAAALKADLDTAMALVEAARRGEAAPETPTAPTAVPKDEIERRAAEIAAEREYQRQITSTISAGDKEFGREFTDSCNTLADLGANERPEFMQIVTDTDGGHKVLQHLGQNPEEADRILRLPPHKMAMEIGRISDKLNKPKEVPVSKAPEPIKPIEGDARVVKSPDEMDDEEWFKWRAESKAKARQARR
jgi:hypothetical protein